MLEELTAMTIVELEAVTRFPSGKVRYELGVLHDPGKRSHIKGAVYTFRTFLQKELKALPADSDMDVEQTYDKKGHLRHVYITCEFPDA